MIVALMVGSFGLPPSSVLIIKESNVRPIDHCILAQATTASRHSRRIQSMQNQYYLGIPQIVPFEIARLAHADCKVLYLAVIDTRTDLCYM